MLSVLLAFALQAAPGIAGQTDVRSLAFSAPEAIVPVDLEKLNGRPARLAVSDDGRWLYVRTAVYDRWGNERSWHYVVDVGRRDLAAVPREPEWAAASWAAKSALHAPGVAGFRVEMDVREERVTATGVVGAGAMAGHPGDPTLGAELGPQGAAIASSAMQGQKVAVTTLRLKGERIGEFVNTPAVPGLTFGWGPTGTGLIAYVDLKGRLGLMDRAGRKLRVQGAGPALLPAWGPGGTKLFYLERTGKKQYEVKVVDLSSR